MHKPPMYLCLFDLYFYSITKNTNSIGKNIKQLSFYRVILNVGKALSRRY